MRIGLVISNKEIKTYELIELENLINSNYKIDHIYSEKKFQSKKKIKILEILKSIYKNKFFYFILIENFLSRTLKIKNFYLDELKKNEKKVNIFIKFKELEKIPVNEFECYKIKNQFIFDDISLKHMKENCDVLILLGFNRLLHKNCLNITRYGILSFHTSDTNKYRGRPAGFYEFINDEEFGGVTLQRLNEKIDSGEILENVNIYIKDCKSYEETLQKMMGLKSDMIVKGLEKLENNLLTVPLSGVQISYEKDKGKIKNIVLWFIKTIKKKYLS